MSRQSIGLAREAQNIGDYVLTLATGTTALTPHQHANRLLQISTAASAYTLNLPYATGSGDVYEFLLTVAHTSGSIIINATHPAGASNTIVGSILQQSSGNFITIFSSTANDIITLNNTTQGGVKAGDYLKLQDVAATTWRVVFAMFTTSGAQATPFSG